MIEAELASNAGDERLVLSFGSRLDWQGEAAFEAEFRLLGRHFDADHEHHVSVVIDGLCLGVKPLCALRDALSRWLTLPLTDLASSVLTGRHELCLGTRQCLQLAFGARTDTISGPNPVMTVLYRAGKLEGEYHLVTDQSCLGLFSEALGRALQTATG